MWKQIIHLLLLATTFIIIQGCVTTTLDGNDIDTSADSDSDSDSDTDTDSDSDTDTETETDTSVCGDGETTGAEDCDDSGESATLRVPPDGISSDRHRSLRPETEFRLRSDSPWGIQSRRAQPRGSTSHQLRAT